MCVLPLLMTYVVELWPNSQINDFMQADVSILPKLGHRDGFQLNNVEYFFQGNFRAGGIEESFCLSV